LDNLARLDHGDVIRAVHQTAGRGRFQRTWVSPAGRCLTLSVILRDPTAASPTLCQAAALAVHATLAEHGIAAQLKWPNDVLVEGRKIAGILAERDTASVTVVLGIGLNVNMTEADLEALDLLQPSTSMAIEGGTDFDTEQVLSGLLAALESVLAGRQASAIHETWSQHDALAGQDVTVATGDLTVSGTYAGMAPDGRLLLTDESGTEHSFWSGDVTLLRSEN
jgi:BirA family biotin operon repressor/biotin-[acetyl-CoA-carboxylase] ligase